MRLLDDPGRTARQLPGEVGRALRRHWLFTLFMLAGAALRGMTLVAYRPAIFGMPDTAEYLRTSAHLQPEVRPIGYSLFLRILPLENGLAVVPLAQHLLGLLIAILIYVVLLRLGVPRWLAALASIPVLLDAFQLDIEQYVLSDTLFEVLLVAGCVIVLWQRPLELVAAPLGGAVFAAAVLTRGNALLVVVPVVAAMVFMRSRLLPVSAFVLAFTLPVAGYVVWYHDVHGVWALTGREGYFLYARVAPFANCGGLSLPPYERALCPGASPGERLAVRQYVHSERSPIHGAKPPPGMSVNELAGDFARRIIRHQPLAYARAVASDFVRGFAPTRTQRKGEPPIGQWQFTLTEPIFNGGSVCVPGSGSQSIVRRERCDAVRRRTNDILRAHGDKRLEVGRSLATTLRAYQGFGYAPGPLLGAGLLIGIVAALGIGRARGSGLRAEAFLFSSVAACVLLTSIAALMFSWRYQLPQLVLLPPAAAVGITALAGWKRDEASEGKPC